MIEIDFANPLDQVRMNIGDIERDLVSDATITSALVVYNNNVNSTSVALFQMLCTHFSKLAEKEQVGELQVEYKKRYENSNIVIIESFRFHNTIGHFVKPVSQKQ